MSVGLNTAARKLLDDGEYRRVPRHGASDHVGEDANNVVVEFEVGDAAERCGEQRVFVGWGGVAVS